MSGRIRSAGANGRLIRQGGFSLLEILVAFSILSISLGILLNIFSEGANTAVMADEYTTATQIADSRLAGVGVENPLQPGQYGGSEGQKYQWTVTIEPYDLVVEGVDTHALPATLYLVTVSVSWDVAGNPSRSGGRSVVLTTLKLGEKAA